MAVFNNIFKPLRYEKDTVPYRHVTPECLVSKLQQVTSWLSLNLYGASVCSSVSFAFQFETGVAFEFAGFHWFWLILSLKFFISFNSQASFSTVSITIVSTLWRYNKQTWKNIWNLLCFDACGGENDHSSHKNDPNLLRAVLYFIPPIYCCAINNCNRPENNREFNLRGAANWLRCEPLNCLSQTNSSMEAATGKAVLWTIMYNTSYYFLTRLWDWTLDRTALRSAHPHTEACGLYSWDTFIGKGFKSFSLETHLHPTFTVKR